jgi:hypothetical protein
VTPSTEINVMTETKVLLGRRYRSASSSSNGNRDMRAKLDAPAHRVNESRQRAFHTLDTAKVSPHSQNPMSRVQFMVLNLVGGVCGLLIVCDLILGYFNGRLNQSVAATRDQFAQAQQIQNTAQNLVIRVAQAGRTDPVLRELLVKHDFKVTINTNSPPRPSP